MSNTKDMSKRQIRREQIRRKEQRGRLIGIGLISLGAIFFVYLPKSQTSGRDHRARSHFPPECKV